MRLVPTFTLWSTLLIGAAFAGCMPDQNLVDYKRQKLSEELARLEPIRGTFRGVLKAGPETGPSQEEEDLGALELTFAPQIRVVPGGPSERADGRPVLNARLQFEDRDTRLATSVTDGYFDAETGRFLITVTLSRAGGRTEELTLGGLLNRDTLTGELSLAGSAETTGNFSLKRDPSTGSLSEIAQKLSTKPWFSAPSSTRDGTTRFSNGAIRASRIVILEPESTPEDAFLNRFAPVRNVQFTVNFGDAVRLVHEAALWDERTRKLTGRARLGTIEILTECTSPDATSWSCRHEVAGSGKTATGEYAPGMGGAPVDDAASDRSANQWRRTGSTRTSAERVSSVWLQVTRPARSRSDELTELFNPSAETLLTATLQFGLPDSSAGERITVVFENSRYDKRSLTLDGRAQLRATGAAGNAGSPIEVTIRCTGLLLDGLAIPQASPAEVACDYWSTQLAAPLRITF